MNSINILIVEDDQKMATILGDWFEMYNEKRESLFLSWETAGSVMTAIDRLMLPGIDVCLLDVNLPNGQGVGTVMKLLCASPETPVVVLTGDDSKELEAACRGVGRVDDYVRKSELGQGVDVSELVWKLHCAAQKFAWRSQIAVKYKQQMDRIREEKTTSSAMIAEKIEECRLE